MENNHKHDLVLTGNSSVAGGTFNKVKITGDQTINGNIDCTEFRLTGTCNVNGNVRLQTGKITGTTEIKGKLVGEQLRLVGTIDIDGDTLVKELKVKGEVKVSGDVSTEKCDVFGYLDVKGNYNTEEFLSKSPFNIDGLLNAGNVDIQLHCKCHAGEIGGETINIRRGKDMIIKKLIRYMYLPHDFYEGKLITDVIEGDNIYVEYTKAKVIRGNSIKVGPGCEIELIEYKDSFEEDADSKIIEKRKL